MDLSKIKNQSDLRTDPTGSRIFVVSSLNGSLDLLQRIVQEIETCGTLAANDKIVFLGNYLSKKDSSRNVLDYLRAYRTRRWDQVIFLKGENEQRYVNGKKSFFSSDLGKSVINSYREPSKLDVVNLSIDRRLIKTMPSSFSSNSFYFVHAGVNPHQPLDKQDQNSLMFIRDLFYESSRVFDKIVVHGFESEKAHLAKNRIGVGSTDNAVSCMVLNDSLKDGDTNPVLDFMVVRK